MHHSQQSRASELDSVRTELMDVYFDIHQNEETSKHKSKAKRKHLARRGIEVYYENKELQAQLQDGWEEA